MNSRCARLSEATVQTVAASTAGANAPSPLVGEGSMVLQQIVRGEGARYDELSPRGPLTHSVALRDRAALSHGGSLVDFIHLISLNKTRLVV